MGVKPVVGVILGLMFFAALLDLISCKDEGGKCKKYKNRECPDEDEEIYKTVSDDGRKVHRKCCTKGSGNAQKELIKASGCQISACIDPTEYSEDDVCDLRPIQYVQGKKMEYVEAFNDSCIMDYGDDGVGIHALCCPKNSKEGLLTLLLGAEKHQFPHYALISVKHDGNSHGTCGGTIYNERYIITASHCMLHDGVVSKTEGSYVKLDVWMKNGNSLNKYDVEEFIPHPKSTRWNPDASMLYNDVGLIKLKQKIQFGPNIKALPIAKTGFNPFKYSNETVLIGVGDTDTTQIAIMLQRVRTLLRQDKKNIETEELWGSEYTMEQADGLLFLGGIQDGVTSPRSGPGDSGGPAICRDEDGYALMCGTDSSGPDLAKCEKKLTPIACMPLAYMETQHYYDWFVEVAGDQSNADVLKVPLFGAPVKDGKYKHQVHITTKDGFSCGGTLIEKDIVVTAAHCVVEDDGTRDCLANKSHDQ